MALNKFMHPRNIYRIPPDFKQLAQEYPEFDKYVNYNLSGKAYIDFSDPNALLCLTRTLLKRDFNLDIEMPSSHLIPTVPQRLNYVLWIEDILSLLLTNSDGVIKGIDIGTGPSCIYPLLGSRKNGWKFLASELNEEMLEWAKKNVHINNLDNYIEVIKGKEDTVLEDLLCTREGSFDFCLCNPPFFSNCTEADKESRTTYRPLPKAKNPASEGERIVEGGEVEFVKKIIQDSLKLKDKVRFYSSMLGKKKNLETIKKELKNYKSLKYITTEFCQGRTMRWGVAWTFLHNVDLKQIPGTKRTKEKPPLFLVIPNNLTGINYTIEGVMNKIKSIMEELKITYCVTYMTKNKSHMWMQSESNTWSHQRRKRREMMRQKEQKNATSAQACNLNSSNIDNSAAAVSKKNMHENKETESFKCMSPKKSEVNTNNSLLCSSSTYDSQTEDTEWKNTEDAKRKNCEVTSAPKFFKKLKMDEIKYDNTSYAISKPLLFCDLYLKKESSSIILEMQCKEESVCREAMHEVLQLFKNRLK